MTRAEKLFTRLRAARLDNTLEAEFRRLGRLDLLIVDDFALRPLDATTTADFYELVVERHKKAATIFTSNRDAAKAHMFPGTYAGLPPKRYEFALRRASSTRSAR